MFPCQSELVALLSHVQDLLATADLRLIELNPLNDAALQITLILDEGPAGISEFPLSPAAIQAFPEFLESRTAPWPDLRGQLGTCRHPAPRLLLAPKDGNRAVCSVRVLTENDKPLIQLKSMINTQILSLQELIKDELTKSDSIEAVLDAKSGLLLTNRDIHKQALDASSLALAARPDALLIREDELRDCMEQCISLATDRLVILSLPQDDPIAMIVSLKKLCKADRPLENSIASLLLGAWAARSVRKTCEQCRRPTPVSDSSLNRVPASLRALTKPDYPFGRGCQNCESTAYQGHSLIEAWFQFNSKAKLAFLDFGAETALNRLARERGTCSLVEDGVRKIFSGITSFEDVFDSHMPPEAEINKIPSILLIEDDTQQRNVIEALLRKAGYDVIAAENGSAALELLESRAVNLVICDVMMPVLSGKEFLERLRASGHREVPVLVLTAVHDTNVEYDLLDAGADDYCEKTVKRKILLKRVQRLLSRPATGTRSNF